MANWVGFGMGRGESVLGSLRPSAHGFMVYNPANRYIGHRLT